LAKDHIPPEAARAIIAHIQDAASYAQIYVESHGRLITNRPIDGPTVHTVVDARTLGNASAAKIAFELSEIHDTAHLADTLPPASKLLRYPSSRYGEIVSISASKVTGLTDLLARWDLTMQNVIAFGDDAPDTEMLALSAIGVAMGNATPEVKAAADLVTESNDEEGIVIVLEQHLLRF
jgi:hydroxymethylpyrimidine pyrophosphatase-like HAD family hydrolase